MAAALKEAAAQAGISLKELEYVGLGCPGMIDYHHGVVVYSNNLEFYHEPLGEKLSQQLEGLPVWMGQRCGRSRIWGI